MAEAFSIHHKQKIQNLTSMAPTNPTIDPASRVRAWLSQRQTAAPEFSFKAVTSKKLHQLLKRLKPGKALPEDEIDAKTIKDAAHVLAPAIKHIVNLSLQQGHFASGWKPQLIAPHYNKW